MDEKIEKMAKLIKPIIVTSYVLCDANSKNRASEQIKKDKLKNATALYNAGYRKESDTAREILTELVKRAEKISFFDCRMGLDLDELAEKYGVDLGE